MTVAPSFTIAPSNPYARQNITFTDTSTGGPAAWLWDFGDGETETVQNPVHAYTVPGTYPVTLTVNGTSTATGSIVVRRAVVFGDVELSADPGGPAPYWVDHGALVKKADLEAGGKSLQAVARGLGPWDFTCLATTTAEIDALHALIGGWYTLNIDGVEHPGCTISSFRHKVGVPDQYPYLISFEKDTAGGI